MAYCISVCAGRPLREEVVRGQPDVQVERAPVREIGDRVTTLGSELLVKSPTHIVRRVQLRE